MVKSNNYSCNDCNCKNELFKFQLVDNIKRVTFDSILVKTFGLDKQVFVQSNLNLPHDQVFEGVRYPKIILSPHQLFIYTNIIEPIIVGDVNVPLLKSVWLDKYEDDQIVQILIKNPMYIPVALAYINNIEINIRDDSGKLIKFGNDSKTHLTLHFRKRNV